MRVDLRLGIGFVVAIGLFACKSESDPPVYLALTYQVRCIDCSPRSPDEPEREVNVLDGEFGWDIQCNVARLGGKKHVTLDAQFESERSAERYGVQITRANIESGDPSNECEVQIVEGANTYQGACTGDTPDGDHPCRVRLKEADGLIKGSVFCSKIPNMVNLSSFRYFVDPGSTDEGAKFEIHNCSGL